MVRNLCRRIALVLLASLATWLNAAALADDPLPPDVVVLNSGGELEGQVSEQKVGNRTIVDVKRADGTTIQLAKDQVKFIRRPKEAYAEYLSKKSQMADTIDGHWEMSQWCRENLDSRLSNSAGQLGPERRYHLQAILKLDPDHKNARALLGYTKEKGVWINLEQKRLGHGFILYNKRWLTREEVALEEGGDGWKDQQITWTRRLKKLRNSNGDPSAAVAEFNKIEDPAAIQPLVELMGSEKSIDWQFVYVDGLGNIRSSQAARALCDIAVTSEVPEVRERAVARLKQDHVDKRAASEYLSNRYLKSDKNDWINRAGFVIGELGGVSAVIPLIDALITEHIVDNPLAKNPGSISPTFSNQGSGISSGSGQPKKLKVTSKNHSVVDALRRISGADFAFDEQGWKNWYAQQHTLTDVEIHRDE